MYVQEAIALARKQTGLHMQKLRLSHGVDTRCFAASEGVVRQPCPPGS